MYTCAHFNTAHVCEYAGLQTLKLEHNTVCKKQHSLHNQVKYGHNLSNRTIMTVQCQFRAFHFCNAASFFRFRGAFPSMCCIKHLHLDAGHRSLLSSFSTSAGGDWGKHLHLQRVISPHILQWPLSQLIS